MKRLLFLVAILFSAKVYAGDILYYVCMGEDLEYQVAALQQVITKNNDTVSSTFALDLAGATDEYMTRYYQKGDLVFKTTPIGQEESQVVEGTFEKDGKEIGLTIISSWKTGHRAEISVDQRVVNMHCKKKN